METKNFQMAAICLSLFLCVFPAKSQNTQTNLNSESNIYELEFAFISSVAESLDSLFAIYCLVPIPEITNASSLKIQIRTFENMTKEVVFHSKDFSKYPLNNDRRRFPIGTTKDLIKEIDVTLVKNGGDIKLHQTK